MDANGILNVSAKDSSTGKSETITIKNDKGRLSKEEIEKMLADAEKYKAEDDRQKEKIEARNKLEGYVFGVKQAVEEASAEKLAESEKQQVLIKCKEALNWLDSNGMADKEEFVFKMKEIEKETAPIMMKLHGAAGKGQPAGAQGQANGGPTIEEVD